MWRIVGFLPEFGVWTATKLNDGPVHTSTATARSCRSYLLRWLGGPGRERFIGRIESPYQPKVVVPFLGFARRKVLGEYVCRLSFALANFHHHGAFPDAFVQPGDVDLVGSTHVADGPVITMRIAAVLSSMT